MLPFPTAHSQQTPPFQEIGKLNQALDDNAAWWKLAKLLSAEPQIMFVLCIYQSTGAEPERFADFLQKGLDFEHFIISFDCDRMEYIHDIKYYDDNNKVTTKNNETQTEKAKKNTKAARKYSHFDALYMQRSRNIILLLGCKQ